MSTHLELHHIGEIVLCGLLESLSTTSRLADVPCKLHPGCSLGAVLIHSGLHAPLRFAPNVPLAPVTVGGQTMLFDGAHGVDVVCHDGVRGVGIEAKLGFDRLSAATFATRFLKPLTTSTHAQPRVNGSMAAILSHRQLPAGPTLPLRTSAPALDLAPDWWLVVRRDTWQRWGTTPPALTNAHVALFEDIALAHGNATDFDNLVLAQVGTDFHSAWKVY